MLACYLAKHLELSASDAVAKIRALRPGSVDTEKQLKAIESYVESLRSSQRQSTDWESRSNSFMHVRYLNLSRVAL